MSTCDVKNLFNTFLNETSDLNKINMCLISNTLLENNYITLDCSHCFNYIPLYNEILNQKTKKILDNARLKIDEIKCPYCRTISKKLLPFFKYYNVKQIRGVNSPSGFCIKLNECQYITKKTGEKCTQSACLTNNGWLCNKHIKFIKEDEQILEKFDNNTREKYIKKKVAELKNILKLNSEKISGNKLELVNRIIIKQNKKSNWLYNE
tara:strand:+ start:39 stop:662 length:624 start_codon:yes stop_codon:yes gene_type:complete